MFATVPTGSGQDFCRELLRPPCRTGLRPPFMTSSRHVDPDLAAATRLVAQAGLFEKRPAFYVRKFVEVAALLALGVAVMANFESLALRLVAALVLALAFTQVAYIGHDAGHHQVFPKRRHNDWLGLILVNLCVGFSYGWWVDKHNRHHDNPNDVDHDPDIHFPLVIFDRQQLEVPRSRFQKFFVRHQALFFFPVLTLLAFSMKWDAVQFLRQTSARYRWTEMGLLVAHVVLFGWAVYGLLGFTHGLLFVLVHQAAFGVMLGSAFAANHKGMPILREPQGSSVLWRQIVTTRNLREHPLTNFWYGGAGLPDRASSVSDAAAAQSAEGHDAHPAVLRPARPALP